MVTLCVLLILIRRNFIAKKQNAFAKRQREMEKKYKAQEKRKRREERKTSDDDLVINPGAIDEPDLPDDSI